MAHESTATFPRLSAYAVEDHITSTTGAFTRPDWTHHMTPIAIPAELADRHLAMLREREVYTPHALHAMTLFHADESGVWHPPTQVGLRRSLARRGRDEARPHEVENAVRQAVAQGLLSEGSNVRRLMLSGAPRSAEQDHDGNNTNDPEGDIR